MSTIVCPQCNKDDMIQKVSAILASGTASGNFSGPSGGYVNIDGKSGSVSGYAHLSGSSITDLAKLFRPPAAPNAPSKSRWTFSLSGIIVLIVYCLFQSCVLPIFFQIPKLILGPNWLEENSNNPIAIIGILVFAGGLIAGIGFLWYVVYRRLEKSSEIRFAQAKEKYAVEKPRWDDAMAKWNRLYYCHRNGIVFDPENGEMCEPTTLPEFLYKPAGG